MTTFTASQVACPRPASSMAGQVTLAHGEGGRLSRQLIQQHIVSRLKNSHLAELGDSAVLPAVAGRLAFTTDSFVVSPLFFPGGDIGRLAVFGTVNDLVVAGAVPRWLSLSLILEEGLPLATLDCVLNSVAAAADEAGVVVVAGDTKVVPRGAADGMFITTAGIGELIDNPPEGPRHLQPGDQLLVTGPIGQHGLAVLAAREQLAFDPAPQSDCAPLTAAFAALRTAGITIRAMRDATRGGVAAVLHEWSSIATRTLVIDEARLPVSPAVRGISELLGLDPVHVANEGTMVVAVPGQDAERAVDALRRTDNGAQAAIIGEVREAGFSPVLVRRALAREVPLDEPAGALLPRIC